MNFNEILKEQGLTEEQIEATLEKMKTEQVFVTEGENPQKRISKLEAAASQQKQVKEPNTEQNAEIERLKAQVTREKIEKELIKEFTKAGATDMDYLMYTLEKSGELAKITTTEDGKVSGAKEAVEALKTSHVSQFATSEGQNDEVPEGAKKYDAKTLEDSSGTGDDVDISLEDAIEQHYAEQE